MKKLVIIGNWKMNKTFSETQEFLKEFAKIYKEKESLIYNKLDFAVASPFTNLFAFKENKISELKLAAQNVSQHLSGAYTGEVSINMLKDLNTKYVILGHSERRSYYGETNEIINAKAQTVLSNGLIPVICVGETLEEYENGKTKEIVKKQIEESLKSLDYSKIIVAYEPIWAIGTGKVATPEIAQDVCEYIHSITSKNLIVQYGGSVSPKNISELSSQKDIDGFLVGGASLDANSFVQLLTLGK
ncbi:triose-phosphate isomerase [Mycoplasmopsis felis]|uniref:triose-phosphate isomerase n=1 Tax=Mycoplasmopsis felis TaxID=33923 RepID=UPI0021AE557D|nr:triose-phosphate isomerase [Mycoplasmopsis felis]MCU9934226.1 triose-phosphate isomerase [Mycoplasmopsis felis]MCU9938616.1 triose-phosphate isomerase [Mycoplasmopsis felis]MCU9939813.1 triose-phosphate isomerase [Mycoplasmopsis felis]UWV79808.1 triose-phosphate isomerase [Mycoplasmopsis felis]UWV84878.1 triose-phosphate isomerase [Mycoplasmopsis felis]